MTLLDVALVRFTVGAAVVIVLGQSKRDAAGCENATEGYARPPGGEPVFVRRVGRRLWRQA